jgi:PAS domain S-box-containing protein
MPSSKWHRAPAILVLTVLALITVGGFAHSWFSRQPGDPAATLWLAAGGVAATIIALSHAIHIARASEKARTEMERRALANNTTLVQLKAFWETAPLSIMLLEPHDPEVPVKIIDCNPMCCEIHGYSREELIGQCVDLIEAQPWAGEHAGHWIRELHEHSRLEGESKHRRKDGTVFDIEYFTNLLVVDGHELVLGMDHVATARKQAELARDQMHQQLRDASRQAGMAEVATDVLHNVGNVLNSVNVSATLVTDQLRHSKAANLTKICELLGQHREDLAGFLTNDPKGAMIPLYLGTLAENLAGEQKVMTAELECLRKNIEHIKDIVAMQQDHAKTAGVIETVSVPDLLEDAIRVNAGSLAQHKVDTAREYLARPVVTLDKYKVMQILINLIRNATHACDESGRTDKRITGRITADDHQVHIAIIDNGVGIPRENHTRIFNQGFTTTRKHGHGSSLHSAALAAKELGGALNVQSDGPGYGATFILELPLKPETTMHETPVL